MTETNPADAQTLPQNSASQPDGSSPAAADAPVIRGRYALGLILLAVILADATVYRTAGWCGPAVFFVGIAGIFFIGIPQRKTTPAVWLLSGMLLVLSARMAINGFGLQLVIGCWLLCGLVLALRGRPPFVLEAVAFGFQSIPGGAEFFQGMNRRVKLEILDPLETRQASRLIDVAFPAVAALLFGGIFVMANPDMVSWVSGQLSDVLAAIGRFFARFSLLEILFWISVAWVTGGFLRPLAGPLITGTEGRDPAAWGSAEAPLFSAYRNTLFTVICLFAVYLAFESRAFLARQPPAGFTYSSYAHEGAAWLTVALLLATVMLSLIFRGRTLADPRLHRLQLAAWIWSALNLLLALAVFNRMFIYIGFNGMTRMRIVGLLGILAVTGGFAMVVLKIRRRRDFLWLIRRQLWVAGSAVFVFVALPVDHIIHRYNVSRILSGSEAPVVQITEHPIDPEALPLLLPLCESTDARLRGGIQALLSARTAELQETTERAQARGWTAWQKSHTDSLARLTSARSSWDVFATAAERDQAFRRLKDYAWQTWW